MKIVVTGAESTGKTTLISKLAEHYQTPFVKEFARDYLQVSDGDYGFEDLALIAEGQHHDILNAQDSNPLLSLADTDLLTIKIWSEYKYGKCDPWIIETLENHKPDLYLLCTPDIPWQEDPLRENPNDREELHRIYQDEIKNLGVPFVILSETLGGRLQAAIVAIEGLKDNIAQ